MTTAMITPEPVDVSTARRTVARLSWRQVRRTTVIVAVVAAGMSAMVAAQYQATFADQMDPDDLRALTENPAVRILFGTPLALDDPGGFTVWRTGTVLLVLCGMWALLAATRLTRGAEEAGHWDLLLAGRLRVVDLVARYAATMTVAAAVISAGMAAGLILFGTAATGAVLHALCVFGSTVAFAGVGLLAGQLLPSRAAAAGLASAVLAVSLLTRMLADGATALAWLGWLTPFGLAARVAPYAHNRIVPLLVLLLWAVVPTVGALLAAARRDLGGASIGLSDTRRARTRLLGSVSGFAVRRASLPTAGWGVGVVAYFLLIGSLISSILEFFDTNPRFADLAATAGVAGIGSATGFAAALFGLLTIPAGLYAATRIATFAADEKARRWTALHALPLTRYRAAGVEIATTAAGVVALLLAAAIAMWSGAILTGAPLSLLDTLAGVLNIVPIALLALAAATLALGCCPDAVTAIGAIPVAGGFLLDVLAQSIGAPPWVRQISPFAHLAAVPHTPPDWTASITMTAIAIATAATGLYLYAHRDLRT